MVIHQMVDIMHTDNSVCGLKWGGICSSNIEFECMALIVYVVDVSVLKLLTQVNPQVVGRNSCCVIKSLS